MALASGTRLGPYEIEDVLGAGGMGEVYRARDTRLGRSVAVKICHLGTGDGSPTEGRQRFEVEARAVSALSHPNICALYDVGNADGVEYLVMELVTGETLEARLTRGPLPIGEALRVAREIAAALDAAHRRGIVHRDLKPANVMLTRSGPKLLDFGLARFDGRRAATEKALASDATRVMTGEGMVLGTLHYMSPEQVEGRTADHRADLFAFGALLYEMVSGVRPFDGTSPVSVMSAILRDTPAPLRERMTLAPAALERLVDACLAKDPESRWQNAHDLALELDGIAAALGERPAGPSARPMPRRRAVAVAAALVAAAVLAGLAVAGATRMRESAPPPAITFGLPPPTETGFSNNRESPTLAVFPDGRELAFIAGGRIWTRRLDELTPRALDGTDGANSMFVAADGSIGFVAAGRIRRIPRQGGPALTVCEVPQGLGIAATWGRTDIVYATVQGEGLYRVPASGGTPQRVLAPDTARNESRILWPRFMADGETLLYLVADLDEVARLMLWVPGRDPVVVGEIGSRVELLAPDWLLWAQDGALVAQRFDADGARFLGAPVVVAPQVLYFRSTRWAGFAASLGGTIALASIENVEHLAWIDPAGHESGREGEPGQLLGIGFSSDGRLAVIDRMNPTVGSYDIWLRDLEHGTESRLTSHVGSDFGGLFLPGDGAIVYSSAHGRTPRIRRRDLATGAESALIDEPTFQIAAGATPDGNRLLVRQRSFGGGFDLGVLPLAAAGAQPHQILPQSANVTSASLSPDGRLVAYVSRESGGPAAYVAPLDTSALAVRVSPGDAIQVAFANGSELRFVDTEQTVWSVAIHPPTQAKPITVGAAERRFRVPGMLALALSPDGRMLAVVRDRTAASQPLSILTGWRPPTG